MKVHPNLYNFEEEYSNKGYKYIAGTDEAGRGPLAGPVFAAAVILNKDDKIPGLFDSKQFTKKEREVLYEEIKKHALSYSVVMISANEIDKINILEASRKGMEQAILNLKIKPDFILTDFMDLKNTGISYLKLVHGDALSASIGAASIMAKVERDQYMDEMDKTYPGYGFSENKGYPTKKHKEALMKLGPSPIHRLSYKPVKDSIDHK